MFYYAAARDVCGVATKFRARHLWRTRPARPATFAAPHYYLSAFRATSAGQAAMLQATRQDVASACYASGILISETRDGAIPSTHALPKRMRHGALRHGVATRRATPPSRTIALVRCVRLCRHAARIFMA